MPARQDTLAEEQRWNGINYVRATFGTRTDQTPAGSGP